MLGTVVTSVPLGMNTSRTSSPSYGLGGHDVPGFSCNRVSERLSQFWARFTGLRGGLSYEGTSDLGQKG